MAHASIDPRTVMGLVSLTVSNLERSMRFYTEAIGLQVLTQSKTSITLGTESPLIELVENTDALARAARTTGLYHFALLHPTRYDLARTLRRLINSRWPLTGMSDHLVSEALYLDDPDGIGIELYSDRHRNEWPRHDGNIAMAVDPLDVASLLAELGPDTDTKSGMPAGMTMGHVHLNVSDLAAAERFYVDILGFDIVFQMHSALFVSAGGYHHHLGLNTWNGIGAPPPPPHSLGLRHYTITVADLDVLEHIANRLRVAGEIANQIETGYFTIDPAGNRLLLIA